MRTTFPAHRLGVMAILAFCAGSLLPIAAGGERARPNILFILTDDQRWDAMSCMGNPFVKTPNMDRIRNEGALFANAFVTTSLCSPSRASFLTGTYAHTHGVFGNRGLEFDPEQTPSFPLLLQKNGYETAFVGKWHMGKSSDPHAGFDYWLSFSGQGVYENPPLNENGREFKAQGYMTDILTEYALKFLDRDRDKPFCLYLSHKAVHGPFTPAERHRNLLADAQIPKPPSFDDTFAGKPRWQREAAIRGWGGAKRTRARQEVPESIPPAQWDGRRKSQLDYYRALSAVDEGIGRVLEELDNQGKLDNTAIFFAGDNGYFHGEHRRGDKRLMYEEALRIPLLMRYPPLVKPGTTIDQMVLNIDMAPTILDLAGIAAAEGMQGESVVPLFHGKNVDWRQSFLYEYWVDLTPAIPRMIGVRSPEWKLVEYPDLDDIPELYFLQDDQYELKNLAQDEAYAGQLGELQKELTRLMNETGYRSPEPDKPTPRGNKPVLHFSFDDGKEPKVVDGSGNGNHGKSSNVTIADGRQGRAASFDGQGSITVERSESLSPANSLWTVEAWIEPAADGVVLAHGGASRGYILFVEKGVPSFGLRTGNGDMVIVDGREPCLDRWTHVAGVIDDHRLRLFVNGEEVATLPFMQQLTQSPNDGISIGADVGSPVLESISGKPYRGLVDELTIHPRALSAEELKDR